MLSITACELIHHLEHSKGEESNIAVVPEVPLSKGTDRYSSIVASGLKGDRLEHAK